MVDFINSIDLTATCFHAFVKNIQNLNLIIWEQGLIQVYINDYGFAKDHKPQTEDLFKFISDLDFANGDYFCFKSGGDGDNGEMLMDLIDAYFDSKKNINIQS